MVSIAKIPEAYQKRAETLDGKKKQKDVCNQIKKQAGSAKHRYDSKVGLGTPGKPLPHLKTRVNLRL